MKNWLDWVSFLLKDRSTKIHDTFTRGLVEFRFRTLDVKRDGIIDW